MTDRTRTTIAAVLAVASLGVAVTGGAISSGAPWPVVAHIVAFTIPACGWAALVAHTLGGPDV